MLHVVPYLLKFICLSPSPIKKRREKSKVIPVQQAEPRAGLEHNIHLCTKPNRHNRSVVLVVFAFIPIDSECVGAVHCLDHLQCADSDELDNVMVVHFRHLLGLSQEVLHLLCVVPMAGNEVTHCREERKQVRTVLSWGVE